MTIAITTGTGNVTTTAASSATSATLSKPANLADGDLLVAAIWARGNTAAYPTVPSGWTAQPPSGTELTTVGIVRIYTKPIPTASGEASTYTWSGGTAGRVCGVMFRVTGASLVSILDVAGADVFAVTDGAGTGSIITLPAITTTHPSDLLIAVTCASLSAGQTRGAFATPGGMTRVGSVGTATGASESDFGVDAEVRSTAASTGSRAFTRALAPTSSGVGYMLTVKGLIALTLSGVVSPSSADTGVARTLTLTASGGNGNTITYGPVDWGDGLADDPAQSSPVFTRTPTVAGTKTWSADATQA